MGRRCLHELDLGRTRVHYQPVHDLPDRRAVGVEALARCHDQRLGHVPPVVFLEAMRRAGRLDDLTETVLRQVTRDAASLRPGLEISVNIAVEQLQSAVSLGGLLRAGRSLADLGHRLVVDVGGRRPWGERGVEVAGRLRARAIGIALEHDDLTPFSAGLLDLPLDRINLHRDVVTSLRFAGPAGSAPWQRAVCDARARGIPVLVEGVLTRDDLTTALRLGADRATGWYWMPATTASQLPSDLRRG